MPVFGRHGTDFKLFCRQGTVRANSDLKKYTAVKNNLVARDARGFSGGQSSTDYNTLARTGVTVVI